MSKRAVILAGGKGTRLKPYTVVLPKPLMPIGDFPILEVIVRQLAADGFDHITMAVNHQAEIIKAFFHDGTRWGINIDYSLENRPLSTMGPLKLIKSLPEDFLVMNGDVLTDLDFAEFFEFHTKQKNIFTISSYVREEAIDYGVLRTDPDGRVCQFDEKPKIRCEVSMGVYCVNTRVLDLIPSDTSYGFDSLMLDLIAAKEPAIVRPHHGYWLDIGRPDDYIAAIDIFEKSSETFLRR
ncbi:MAG: sugar phosphate nucleotidyltransferase [Nitrospirota bacterium]